MCSGLMNLSTTAIAIRYPTQQRCFLVIGSEIALPFRRVSVRIGHRRRGKCSDYDISQYHKASFHRWLRTVRDNIPLEQNHILITGGYHLTHKE
jgi:hypothetical protein